MAGESTQTVRVREVAIPVEDALQPEAPLRQLAAVRLGVPEAIDERLRQPQENQPDSAREIGTAWGRFWLRARRRAA